MFLIFTCSDIFKAISGDRGGYMLYFSCPWWVRCCLLSTFWEHWTPSVEQLNSSVEPDGHSPDFRVWFASSFISFWSSEFSPFFIRDDHMHSLSFLMNTSFALYLTFCPWAVLCGETVVFPDSHYNQRKHFQCNKRGRRWVVRQIQLRASSVWLERTRATFCRCSVSIVMLVDI